MSPALETILIVIGSMSLGTLIPMFWKKVLNTKYITEEDLKSNICPGCTKDMEALKSSIISSTTEERRADMKHFKEGVEEKLARILGVLLVIALKKEGEALSQEDRDKIIGLVTGQKA